MKNKFVWNRDRISSVVLFALSAAILWQCTTIRATFGNIGGSDIGSRAFPAAVAILMMICSVGKFLTCGKPDEAPFAGGRAGWVRMGITIMLLGAYVFGLTWLGFVPSNFVAGILLVVAMKMGKPYKLWRVALFSALVTAVTWFIFGRVMGVWLPTGALWDLLR